MMNPEAVAERRKRSLTSRRAARESSSSPRRARMEIGRGAGRVAFPGTVEGPARAAARRVIGQAERRRAARR